MNSQLNFTNQNLQNRSFEGLNLNGANFSGADIRGCNFNHAQLQGANFAETKIGQAPRVFISLLIIAFVVIIITFQAISQMSFGVLGRTPEESSWSYSVALFVSLGIAGLCASLVGIIQPSMRQLLTIISGTASGALLGFYYGGSLQNNPQVAIISAVAASLMMAFVCFKFRRSGFVRLLIVIAGCVANYGFAFLLSSLTFAFLSTQNIILGSILILFVLSATASTMFSLQLVIKQITSIGVTSFQGANLFNAKFDGAKIENGDFRNTIGLNL
jgi:Pentapeptide repeats (8 copies)